MRYFATHFPIHCHIHQRETKLKFVRKKEDTAHREREREKEEEREGNKGIARRTREGRENLCASWHTMATRKSTPCRAGSRRSAILATGCAS